MQINTGYGRTYEECVLATECVCLFCALRGRCGAGNWKLKYLEPKNTLIYNNVQNKYTTSHLAILVPKKETIDSHCFFLSLHSNACIFSWGCENFAVLPMMNINFWNYSFSSPSATTAMSTQIIDKLVVVVIRAIIFKTYFLFLSEIKIVKQLFCILYGLWYFWWQIVSYWCGGPGGSHESQWEYSLVRILSYFLTSCFHMFQFWC